MKRLWLIPLICLWASLALATPTPTVTATPTPLPPLTCNPTDNLVCNVNNLNPTGPNYGGSAYPSQLYNFANAEAAGRDVEHGWINFVYVGQNQSACLGVPVAGLVMTPAACIAYNAGYRAADPNNGTIGFTSSITFSDSSQTWVAMDECPTLTPGANPCTTAGNNPFLPNFTRISGTHYLIDTLDATEPTMAVDSQLLMRVTTSGGAITAVTDLRNITPGISIVIPSPLTVAEIITNDIEPLYYNGTDHIGPLNGARSGEKNLGDFLPSADTSLGTCTTTASSGTLTNCTLSATAKVGMNLAVYEAGAAPLSVAPSITVTPITGGTSFYGAANSLLTPGCTVFDPLLTIGASLQPTVQTSNSTAYEAGDVVTIEGNSYTVKTVNTLAYTFTTNLLTTVTPPAPVSDAVLNGTTTVTSASSSFSSADVGRPAYAAGIPIGDYIATVSDAHTIVLNAAATTSGTGVALALGAEPITGANCTTTRGFAAAFVEPDGAIGPKSATVYTTLAPNAVNAQNWIQVAGAWDANAIGVAIYGCEGGSCNPTTIIGGDEKIEVFNPQTNGAGATFYANDPLLALSAGKNAPLQFTFHYMKAPYGTDIVDGTSLGANENGTLLGKILTISADRHTVTINATATASVNGATVSYDDGPQTNTWLAATKITATTNCSTGYAPAGQYPLVTPVVAPFCIGPQLQGDGSRGFNSNEPHPPSTNFVWHGRVFQGTAWAFQNNTAPSMRDISLSPDGGSSMGVCLSIDGTGNTATTSQGEVKDLLCGNSVIGLLLAPTNALNVEFFTFDNDVFNSDVTSDGSYGVIINSPNALLPDFREGGVGGAIAFVNYYAGVVIENGEHSSTPGAVLYWSSPYSGTPSVIQASRNEVISRAVYSPLQTGNATLGLKLDSNIFDGLMLTPDCLFIEPGNGPITLINNRFLQPTAVAYLGIACPSGIIGSNNGSSSSLTSHGNVWANIGSPFSNALFSSNLDFAGDLYQNPATTNYTVVPQPASAIPTIGIIFSGCPFTLTNVQGGTQVGYSGTCSSMAIGGTLDFPHVTSGVTDYAEFRIQYNGQMWCNYDVNIATDGSSGSVLMAPERDPSGVTQACDDQQNNPGTFNCFYLTSGTKIECQNNTSVATPAMGFTYQSAP